MRIGDRYSVSRASSKANHVGFCASGTMEVKTADDARATVHGGDSYTIPPGHDAWIVGDEAFVGIEFSHDAGSTPRSCHPSDR